jgi:O-antigen ligase
VEIQTSTIPEKSFADSRSQHGEATGFPWLVFVITSAITFGIQHRMDASLIWLDGGGPASQMAQNAADGNTSREILISLLGLMGVVLLYRHRAEKLKLRGWTSLVFLCYFGWAAVSCVWAQDPMLVVRREIAFAMILTFLFGLARSMSIDLLSLFCVAIPVCNLPIGIFAEIRNGTFHPWSGQRFGGTVHPNLQGAGLALALLIVLWWAWRTRGKTRLPFALAIPVLALFLFWTQSRSSMIALVAAVVFSLVLLLVRHLAASPARLVALAVFALAVVSLGGLLSVNSALPLAPEHEIQTARDDGDPTQLTGRVDLWQLLMTYVEARPVLGYGYDGFWTDQNIENISTDLQWSINQAHSVYIDQWLSLGVVGLTLYVALLLLALGICTVRFLRGDDGYGYCAAVIFFVCIHNFTESINTLPTFPNFAFNLVLIHIAFLAASRPVRTNRTNPVWNAAERDTVLA